MPDRDAHSAQSLSSLLTDNANETAPAQVIGRSEKLPAFLHFCQRHAISRDGREWLFFKRMVPHDLITDW